MKLSKLWFASLFAVGMAHAGNQATVYYYTPYKNWTTVNLHYQPAGGTWTTVPGVAMTDACANWKVRTIDIGTATDFKAVFNNGSGAWDNYAPATDRNYPLKTGIVQVKSGTYFLNSVNPCAVDPTPPTVPTNLASSNVGPTAATLTWTASTDNVGVVGYEVKRGTTVVGTPTGTTFTDTGLSPNTTYSYSVRAKDGAGTFSTAATISVTTPNALTATIHYKRTDNNYTNWCAHLWGTGLAAGVATTWTAPRCFEGTDAYGKFTTFTLSNATVPVGFLIHQGDTKDVATDRFFTPSVNREIWIKQGDATVYTSNPDAPDTQPPTVPTGGTATVSSCSVTLRWNASTDNRAIGGYYVLRNGVRVATLPATALTWTDTAVTANTSYSYTLQAFDTSNNVSASSAAISASVGSCTQPQAATLGATWTATKTTFALWSPDTANVQLWLNGTVYPMAKIADTNGYTNVYAVEVPGDHHLKKYNFRVNGITVRDPYGKMVEPGTQNNIVINTAASNLPTGWAPRPAFVEREDAVIYEVHVRDFSIHSSSGVSADKRGKYLGMVQAGTTLNGVAGGHKTGIDHLVDMGVTHVQILPFYDFGTCSPDIVATQPSCYNWGYDPVNYNVPEERYSATPNDPVARMRELKTMIDEFHKRGIRVVMDVVYNHSYAKEMFNAITPKYYTATDLSGTGNSIDAKQAMVARMIRDSLEYWVREYNIDGFRFDLVGIFDYSVYGDWGRYLNQQFPDRNLLIYGEPWNGFATDPSESTRVRYGTIGVIADARVGVFNGAYREAIKGSSDTGAAGGFMFNQGSTWGATNYWPGTTLGLGPISSGVAASGRYTKGTQPLTNPWDAMFSMDPEQSINYVDAHDNYCLNDKVEAWAAVHGQSANVTYKRRLQEYALSMVLTSQGIPFLHGGSEMLREKDMDHNSYKSSDAVNQYDWNWRSTNAATYDFVKKVIALRKAHPGFRMNTWDEVRTHVKSDQRSASLVVTEINAAANGDNWSRALVIYNSGGNTDIALPAGTWKVALEKSSATAGNDRTVSGSITAEGTAVTVLYQ